MAKDQRQRDEFREYLTAYWEPEALAAQDEEVELEQMKRKMRRQLLLLVAILAVQLVLFIVLISSSHSLG